MENPIWINIQKQAVIPVIVIHDVQDALPLADALQAAGMNLVEITLRTEAALAAIKEILQQRPNMVVGAGTVLNIRQAKQALDQGSQFLVSPGIDEELVDWAAMSTVPILPGVVTPTEIMQGLSMGLEIFKFFPAEAMGGLRTIQALASPFPQVKFIPTGGVNPENMLAYLQKKFIFAVGGSWMVSQEWIAKKDFQRVTQASLSVMERVKEWRSLQAGNKEML